MNRKQLIILGAVTAVLTALALLLGELETSRPQAGATPKRLLPELEAQLNEVSRLTVRTAEPTSVTIELRDGRWGVAEKAAYPADLGTLRRQLLRLAQVDRVEPKTRNPENYARLGLRSLDEGDSQAREIGLWTGEEQELAKVLIGKTGTGGGSYVRLGADPQSWLTSARLQPPAQAVDWLRRDLIDIAAKRIHRIEAHAPAGDPYVLGKKDRTVTDFTLENSPDDKRLKASQAQRIATVLQSLRLDDVLADEQLPQGEEPWRLVRFQTFDGLVIEARTQELDDRHHLRLAVHYAPELAQRFQEVMTAEEVESAGLEETVKAAAETLQRNLQGWTFIIPSYKATPLALSLDELLEDRPEG